MAHPAAASCPTYFAFNIDLAQVVNLFLDHYQDFVECSPSEGFADLYSPLFLIASLLLIDFRNG